MIVAYDAQNNREYTSAPDRLQHSEKNALDGVIGKLIGRVGYNAS